MNNIDEKTRILDIDKSDFYSQILTFHDQIKSSIEDYKNLIIPSFFIKTKNIIICGMGASGAVGDFVYDLSYNESTKPVHVIKDYHLPAFIDSESLVIIVSHSGNTEEAVSCFQEAIQKHSKIIVISSGGELKKLSSKNRVPFFEITSKLLPRNAFYLMAIKVLTILKKIAIIEFKDSDIQKVLKSLEYTLDINKLDSEQDSNTAKKTAKKMFQKNILIVSADHLKSVGNMFRLSINENANQVAFSTALPEFHHGQINGFDFPENSNFIVVFLYSKFYSQKITKRIEITKDILANAGIEFTLLDVVSTDKVSEAFSFLLVQNLISYYLAILNNVDPSKTDKIEYIKNKIK